MLIIYNFALRWRSMSQKPTYQLIYLFGDRVSLCSPGFPQTHGDPSVSASHALGLKAWATMPSFNPSVYWVWAVREQVASVFFWVAIHKGTDELQCLQDAHKGGKTGEGLTCSGWVWHPTEETQKHALSFHMAFPIRDNRSFCLDIS